MDREPRGYERSVKNVRLTRPERRGGRRRGAGFTPRFYGALGLALLVLLILVIVVATRGCGGSGSPGKAAAGNLSAAELDRMKINEMGMVMVLEYHVIGPEDRWSRSPDNFRADLETLYAEGYRCVSLRDYVTNNVRVEVGCTPVIFTFDDSNVSQFRYIEQDGKLIIDPDCAVGIMEDFAQRHPDFGMTATFYVLPAMFGQPEYAEMKLKYLVEHGYDIGNHTVSHTALSKLSPEKAVQEIAGNIAEVRKYLPGYEEYSIALPLGEKPQDPAVLVSGEYGGVSYHFLASLLVGSDPAPAPNDRKFDPMNLPRVQVLALAHKEGSVGSEAWMQFFRDNPECRYRSDGDPSTVTIPRHVLPRVNMDSLGDRKLRTY